MLSPGDRVEGYRVRDRIGEGGVAGVYEVVHDQLGSVHALKVLEIVSPTAGRRLLQEGRLQASVRHANLVAVHDLVTVDGRPALVLEHVDGPTLEAWLSVHRPSVPRALELFRGVVAGVQAMHDAGLMHLDLKPANVLLARIGDELVPKVTDLGLARVVDETQELELAPGPWDGTPAYMAPEQFKSGLVDERADLFALGCVLYELVTGRRAFEGTDILAIAEAAAAGRYTPPEQLVPDLPPAVGAAIRGCLVPDRAMRVPSCAHLVALLDGRQLPPEPVELTLSETVAPTAPSPSPVRPTRIAAAVGLWSSAVIVGGLVDLWLLWPF
jgi:serine/threonine-protein kinase